MANKKESLKYIKVIKYKYKEKAIMIEYPSKPNVRFFQEDQLVKNFGNNFQMRIGVDRFTQVMKLYVRRLNLDFNPRVLNIPFKDMLSVIDYIKRMKKEFENMKSTSAGTELENPKSCEFWEQDSAFPAAANTARLRLVGKKYSGYNLYFNSPILESTKFENYIGPMLVWTPNDVEEFLATFKNFLLEFNFEDL